MLSKAQEKRIRSLSQKKYRRANGECLVEGPKLIDAAGETIELVFSRKDTPNFDKLITTQSPQGIAGIARIPSFSQEDVEALNTIVVLDGVKDPGNVGAIFRACLGFNASLILIESADPSNTKVIRSSAGSIFSVPWIELKRLEAEKWITSSSRTTYRLENRKKAVPHFEQTSDPSIIIVGSEGPGIQMNIETDSLAINHSEKLESLNVAQAVTVALATKNAP